MTFEGYLEYLKNHRINIKKALNMYGNSLCNILDIEYDKLKSIIDKHDLSKYSEDEYTGYNQYFYGENPNIEEFNLAWLHHQNTNKHHPEYWVMRDEDKITVLDMDDYSIAEMLLDWAAVSMAKDNNCYDWYCKHKKYITFSKATKEKVDTLITLFKNKIEL